MQDAESFSSLLFVQIRKVFKRKEWNCFILRPKLTLSMRKLGLINAIYPRHIRIDKVYLTQQIVGNWFLSLI